MNSRFKPSSRHTLRRNAPHSNFPGDLPVVVLGNLTYSTNLGDGLIALCLERELKLNGFAARSFDISGRRKYNERAMWRLIALEILQRLSPRVRRVLVGQFLALYREVRLRAPAVDALENADAAILGGGALLVDTDLNFPLKVNYFLRECIKRNLPIGIYGVGAAGPWSKQGQAMFISAINSSNPAFFAVRDFRSKEACQQYPLLIPEACVFPDPVLLLADHLPRPTIPDNNHSRIGLGLASPLLLKYHSLVNVPSFRTLSDWFIRLAVELTASGYDVVAFSNGSSEDDRYLRLISKRLTAACSINGKLQIADRPQDPEQLAMLIASCDLIIAHRLHAHIAAYAYGIPTIGLRWDQKVDAFFESVERSEYVLDPGGVSPHDVAQLAARALAEKVSTSQRDSVINRAREGVAELAQALRGRIQTAPTPPRCGPDIKRTRARRLVIINDMSVSRGGATAIAVAAAEEAVKREVEVTYITGDDGQAERLRTLGVKIVALSENSLLSTPVFEAGVRGLFNRRAEKLLSDEIRENDTPDTIYYLHNWSHILSPSIFGPLKAVRGRLVMTTHDFFLVCPNGGYVNYPSGQPCRLEPMSINCITSNCDRRNFSHKIWRVARQLSRLAVFNLIKEQPLILTIHDQMRAPLTMGGVPPHCIRTLLNPVEPFSPTRILAETNSEVVFIGRLDHEKGADLACAAARRAGVRLRVIGDGPARADLQTNFPEVVFEGHLTKAEIGPLAAKARILVMPSRYPEPYGLVAVEALWSGLPVIVTHDAFLAPEIIAASAGLTCDPLNIAQFAQAISRLFGNDAEIKKMSHNAFANTTALGMRRAPWGDRLFELIEEHLWHRRGCEAST